MAPWWQFLTDFGDSAVTLPLSVFVVVILLVARHRSTALAWILAIGGCAAAIAVLKVMLQSCGHALLSADMVNPSGHTAMSTVTYGCFAELTAAASRRRVRWLLLAAAAGLALAIALSRIVLHDHSVPEVLTGLAVGAVAAIAFARLLPVSAVSRRELAWIGAAAVATIVVFHGQRWPIEEFIRHIAALVRRASACA